MGTLRRIHASPTATVVEVELLSESAIELIEVTHGRLVILCSELGNSKFLALGSGLQRKCGELTLARNDPAKTTSDGRAGLGSGSVGKVHLLTGTHSDAKSGRLAYQIGLTLPDGLDVRQAAMSLKVWQCLTMAAFRLSSRSPDFSSSTLTAGSEGFTAEKAHY